MNSELVSIIIPVFNSCDFLPECLESIIHQTHKNIEIICIDDGSTDSSQKILLDYAKSDNRIKLLFEKNSGQSFARNNGLSNSSGDYIMFVDSDDWIDNKCIENMLEIALKDECEIVMCGYVREYKKKKLITHIYDERKIVFKNDDVQKLVRRKIFGPIREELKHPENYDAPVSACMQLIKRNLALSSFFHNIHDFGSFEDGLYQICIYEHCLSFCYIDIPYYHYRKFNSNSTTTKYREKLAEKWHNLYNLLHHNLF